MRNTSSTQSHSANRTRTCCRIIRRRGRRRRVVSDIDRAERVVQADEAVAHIARETWDARRGGQTHTSDVHKHCTRKLQRDK